jgi:hypothetical protein
MRTLKSVAGLVVLFVLMSVSPAHAWWDWLDDLSGPGPFNGIQFDFKVLCAMDRPSLVEANMATANAKTLTLQLLRNFVNNLPKSGDADLPKNGEAEKRKKAVTDIIDRLEVLGPPDVREGDDDGLQKMAQVTAGFRDQLRNLNDLPSANAQLAAQSFAMAARLWRQAAIPKIAPSKAWLWARCNDRLSGEPENIGTLHEDRHEVMSLIVNYRVLANVKSLWMVGDPRTDNNNQYYANGEKIYLNILEPKLSWPISGKLDVVDIQTGAGIYWFNSKGFVEGSKTFTGYMIEPVRFDLHFPGKSVDGETHFAKRLLYSVSYSAGVMMFPGGFKGNPFNADAAHAHDIPGSEALFEMGVVINVGRAFGF